LSGPIELIASVPELAAASEAIAREARFALDTESNSFYSYPERVCLVQLANSGHLYILDPMALDNVAALGSLLADESLEKVLHASSNDLRSLDRQWGFRVQNLFDTSVAAAFVGMKRLGLAAVLSELLGIAIAKDIKLQRADWGRRPLDDRLLQYAATDVIHLLRLREVLGQRLRTLGREGWVAEECVRLTSVRYVPPDPDAAFLGIKGSRELDGQALAQLKVLAQFREEEALRLRRPHFRVIPDAALVQLAGEPKVAISEVAGLGAYARPPLASRLRLAIDEGASAPPLWRADLIVRRGRWPGEGARAQAANRLRRLKEWRTQLGHALQLDPPLLWPTASLERLGQEPDTLDGELAAPEVRQWQRTGFGDSLRACVADLT